FSPGPPGFLFLECSQIVAKNRRSGGSSARSANFMGFLPRLFNFSHKVVEERSSSSRRCCLRWTEEVALLESQKNRQYAADCIRLPQTITAADKQTLLGIASAWENRAQQAERQEKRKA